MQRQCSLYFLNARFRHATNVLRWFIFSAYFAKNIVDAMELGRFWGLTDISVPAQKTEPQLLATH